MGAKREKLKDLWIEQTQIGWGGITQFTAWTKGYACPVGVVWCMSYGGRENIVGQIWHSYTHPAYRRRGIRTAINKEILKTHDIIVTGGPKDNYPSGRAFLKSQGYQLSKELGWSYLKPKKRK